ncbi:MAG: protein kinase [Byssovorax sp.]
MSSPSQNSPIEARAARRLGTVIAGKYTLERVLGAGGMATVFLGVHRNGHRVAIKMLHPELSIDPSLAERFVREGYVANAIGHPGTVKVLDDDRAEDGAPFLVMELLEGETLAAAAARHGGTMPAEELLPIAHALCEVLSAAHARGVVHRDIKPENLFLTDEGKLKVLDFGIARVRDGSGTDATQTGRTLGTPAFMPPEQALARTDEIDARTDVWAVGATMFALLSGAHVHEAKTGPEVLVATATRPARSLRDALPEAPAMIVEVVDRALRFARDDRWPSADALRDALEVSYTEAFGAPLPRMYPSPSGGPRAASGPISGGLPRASTTDRSGAKAAIAAAIGKVNAGSSPGPNPASKPAPSPALSSAPTIAAGPVTGAATQVSGAPPPRPARLGLWAALFLAGGLLLSLGVQRLRAPAPAGLPPLRRGASAHARRRACREKLGKPAITAAPTGRGAPLEAEGCGSSPSRATWRTTRRRSGSARSTHDEDRRAQWRGLGERGGSPGGTTSASCRTGCPAP